jgi:hypothetical protein
MPSLDLNTTRMETSGRYLGTFDVGEPEPLSELVANPLVHPRVATR